ncbi:hypothetical protein [Branchiibius hedensis]|nr:hypothetical protein [Branchiibius hedensis]
MSKVLKEATMFQQVPMTKATAVVVNAAQSTRVERALRRPSNRRR